MNNKVRLYGKDNDEIELYLYGEVEFDGCKYVFASDNENLFDDKYDNDCSYIILKQTSEIVKSEINYDIVEDEDELKNVAILFNKLFENENFQIDI